MNHNLSHLPERPAKPRESGLTMVMDKGLSLRQAEDFLEVNADKVDLLKLGFGTSIVTPNVKEKIKLYHDAASWSTLGAPCSKPTSSATSLTTTSAL